MSSIQVSNVAAQSSTEVTGKELSKVEIERLKSLTKDFEAVLVGQMLNSMRESIPEGGLVKNGFGEKVYRSVLDQEFAKMMSGREGDDLSRALFEQLKQSIEKGEKSLQLPIMQKGFRADIDLGNNRYFDKGIIK